MPRRQEHLGVSVRQLRTEMWHRCPWLIPLACREAATGRRTDQGSLPGGRTFVISQHAYDPVGRVRVWQLRIIETKWDIYDRK